MKLRITLLAVLAAGVCVSAAVAAKLAYPPPSTETESVSFRVVCPFSHRAQVDPIVKPGPSGTKSSHMHDFFGNRSTDSNSTYASMLAAGTTCKLFADKAGYWVPTLVAPNGAAVKPKSIAVYYRNRPVEYGTTQPFPPDFRLIAGGVGTFPRAYWNCEGDDSWKVRHKTIPSCGSSRELRLFVNFPTCWDGRSLDSADHRSHVVYAPKLSKNFAPEGNCPPSHPVKIPEVDLRIIYPDGASGPGYKLSDGTQEPHADFWNTWRQPDLERLVRDCLQASVECGTVSG